eukprot:gene845-870_t
MLLVQLVAVAGTQVSLQKSHGHGESFLQLRNAKIVPFTEKDLRPVPSLTRSSSCAVTKSLLAKLEETTAASHKLRSRITCCTTVAGSLPLFTGMVMYSSLQYLLLNPYEVGFSGYYASVWSWSGMLMLLGVMPNDTILIRAMSLVLLICCIFSASLSIGGSAQKFFWEVEYPKEHSTDPTIYICEEGNHNAGCYLHVSKFLVLAFIYIICGVSFCKNLERVEGVQYYDKTKEKGFRFNDGAFKMPARWALDRLWLVFRSCVACSGVVHIGYAIAFHMVDENAAWYSNGHFAADCSIQRTETLAGAQPNHLHQGLGMNAKRFMGGVWVASVAVFSDDRRRRMMAFLTEMNTQGEANSAATVAALLGGRKANVSLKLARSRFRSINFGLLEESDFTENREATLERNTLFKKTKPVKLGRCDAFISHSWSDDGKKKYRALKIWADDFKRDHGYYPEVWLDKACIDQTHIPDDLLCLPIFTAGCQPLLILAGKTYTSRLWCIIEVFVFLKMGGGIDRISVLPINMTEQDAKAMFENVDASTSDCHLENDRQKLLGIVEHGFGNFSEFNQILRHVFRKRLSTVLGGERFFGSLSNIIKSGHGKYTFSNRIISGQGKFTFKNLRTGSGGFKLRGEPKIEASGSMPNVHVDPAGSSSCSE